MRTHFSIAALVSFLAVSAQEESTGSQVASVVPQGQERPKVARWSGSGGSFANGQPIQPISMRAITWEFGDGSLSHIFPPRTWWPSDALVERTACMAPFRERNGGSACVASSQTWQTDDRSQEPRPQMVSENGVPVLVNTGLGMRSLAVRMIDPVTGNGSVAQRCFSSGRWACDFSGEPDRPDFITLQDLATGERWCAGIGL